MLKSISLSSIVIAFITVVGAGAAETWQATLDENFDIADTFDQLRDWYGTIPGGVVSEQDHPEDMPKKLDGSTSIWGIYSQYYTGPNQHLDNWIGDHGSGYRWKTGAKNACINYPPLYCEIDVDTVKGYGSERLGTYFGDGTPTSGYGDIYVFFMLKFRAGFWALADGTTDQFKYPPVIKMFDCVSGFDTAYDWHDTACQPNTQHEYGTNLTLWNASGGGLSRPKYLYFLENSSYTDDYNAVDECWNYMHHPDRYSLAYYPDAMFNAQYLAGQWIGVEYHLNSGTVNTADGTVEFWLYDENGNQFSSYSANNVMLKRVLDYKYNKIVFGGNYQCAGDATCPGETRWYFDDFIVDDKRIGPKYFGLARQFFEGMFTPDSTPPAAPGNLNVK